MSWPEILLWKALQPRPSELKFRKQHPSGPYTADFYCHERRLVIEIDSEAHERGDRPKRDATRDGWFAERGIATMRVSANDVLKNLDGVVRAIVDRAGPPLEGEVARKARRRGVAVEGDVLKVQPGTPLHRKSGPPPRSGEE